MNQSSTENGKFIVGKVTRVADASNATGPTIKGNLKGLNKFTFILGIIHLNVGAQEALCFKDCR